MKTFFLSDFHLGAKYISDPKAHELKICHFLHQIGSQADHIYLLGDVLDYWYEYKEVVPRGFVRFFGTLAELADNGVKITWITGNHDIWLFGYLSEELGVETIDAPYVIRNINGKNFVLAHGDRIGAGSFSFNLITKLFRNKFCQMLYGAIHPRWTVPFAHRWSSNSRYSHLITDDDESSHKKLIMEDAKRLLNSLDSPDYIIMGHHHLTMDEKIPSTDCRLIVLGEWITQFTYASFEGSTLSLHTCR